MFDRHVDMCPELTIAAGDEKGEGKGG